MIVIGSDQDGWDVSSGIGRTALFTATGRALATQHPHALIRDRFAAEFLRCYDSEFVTVVNRGTQHDDPMWSATTEMMAVRTAFFDRCLLDAAACGIRQFVLLAAGLDARPLRFAWPAGTRFYEIDRGPVLDDKQRALDLMGVDPTPQRIPLAADLREDWTAVLASAGFDSAQPTGWLAEGLLSYLPVDAQKSMFDHIVAHSSAGSRLCFNTAIGLSDDLTMRAAATDQRPDFADLTCDQLRQPEKYCRGHGWSISAALSADEYADTLRRVNSPATRQTLRKLRLITLRNPGARS